MASITFTETGGIEANSFSANGEIFVGAVGMVIWWSGTLATIPSNAKVCNGQTLSSSAYPKLYSKIGTKYGGSSSNFALPDLRVGSATSNGRFIRARFDDNVTYQDDAIRNITGYLNDLDMYTTNYVKFYPHGGYTIQSGSLRVKYTSPAVTQTLTVKTDHLQGYATDSGIEFNANSNAGLDGNPMAGHANGDDIHPYNVSMIPIIIVS